MPKVRASSGMIGTIRSPKPFSRMRSLSSRTQAIVVAISCLPDPLASWPYFSGAGSAGVWYLTRRSGRPPPSFSRRSLRYWIASSSSPGW